MFIIEVTGISGAGKSYFINLLKKSKYKFIYDSDLVYKYNLTDLKLFYIFCKFPNMFVVFILIVKIASKLKFNFFNKLNFIRNTIKKIAKNHFFYSLKETSTLIVDEGISHLYQNIIDENIIDSSVVLLIKQLNKLLEKTRNIIVLDAADIIISSRLIDRGHSRIKDKEMINKFINNSRIMISESLDAKYYNIIYVNNKKIIDLEKFNNDIKGLD